MFTKQPNGAREAERRRAIPQDATRTIRRSDSRRLARPIRDARRAAHRESVAEGPRKRGLDQERLETRSLSWLEIRAPELLFTLPRLSPPKPFGVSPRLVTRTEVDVEEADNECAQDRDRHHGLASCFLTGCDRVLG
jgi:hypothetical protein